MFKPGAVAARAAIEHAASGGHFVVLKWARENGCWEERLCARAARSGHLYILKWAGENGCDWDLRACFYAARNGYFEVLK